MNGALLTVASGTPSSRYWTETTPELALTVICTVLPKLPACGFVICTAGGRGVLTVNVALVIVLLVMPDAEAWARTVALLLSTNGPV